MLSSDFRKAEHDALAPHGARRLTLYQSLNELSLSPTCLLWQQDMNVIVSHSETLYSGAVKVRVPLRLHASHD